MRLRAAMYRLGGSFRRGGWAAGRHRALKRAAVLGSLVAALPGADAFGQALQPAWEPAPVVAPPRQTRPPAPPASPQQMHRAKLNQDTLIVAASRPGTTYLAMANDLMAAVGANKNVRVLPVAGDGARANLEDALFLRGIDMAIVPANVLAEAKASNAFGGALAQRLAYVTVLYGEEVHVVAGSGVAAVGDLRGRRVAVPAEDGTAQFTAGDIFRRLGIDVESVPMAPQDALEEVRAGTVAAAVLVGGKPLARLSGLPKDGRVRLLSLPFAALPGDAYAPGVLLAEDYPALIPPGAIVETVAVGAVLVTAKGESSARVAKHAPAVLDAIAALAISERHPKWRDVNLAAALPGWSRFEASEAWLKRASAHRKEAIEGAREAPKPPRPVRAVNPVKASDLAASRHKKLMEEFDAWARQSAAVSEASAK